MQISFLDIPVCFSRLNHSMGRGGVKLIPNPFKLSTPSLSQSPSYLSFVETTYRLNKERPHLFSRTEVDLLWIEAVDARFSNDPARATDFRSQQQGSASAALWKNLEDRITSEAEKSSRASLASVATVSTTLGVKLPQLGSLNLQTLTVERWCKMMERANPNVQLEDSSYVQILTAFLGQVGKKDHGAPTRAAVQRLRRDLREWQRRK